MFVNETSFSSNKGQLNPMNSWSSKQSKKGPHDGQKKSQHRPKERKTWTQNFTKITEDLNKAVNDYDNFHRSISPTSKVKGGNKHLHLGKRISAVLKGDLQAGRESPVRLRKQGKNTKTMHIISCIVESLDKRALIYLPLQIPL